MANSDTPLLDLPAFLRSLRSERRTGMLIHGAPLCGKTRFAWGLAEKVEAGYLDVLETLSQRPELSAAIDQFDPSALRQLTVEFAQSTPKNVILVDQFDFLFPIWGSDLQPFQNMLHDLYNPRRPTAFVFIAQSRPEWESWQLETANHHSRVVEFGTIKAF